MIGVVGGGLSGALVAAHLLRAAQRPLRVVVVEPRDRIGLGVAYSTTDAAHLLNVPMERMSAYCDRPQHFAAWAADRLPRPPVPGSFLPRSLYGSYVGDVLAREARRAAEPVAHVRDRVVDVRRARAGSDPTTLVLASGGRLVCDRVVLALGNLPASRPDWLTEHPRVVVDPWAAGALRPIDGRTLVIGTGLTAIDAIVSSCRGDTGGEMLAVSTTGRLPIAQLGGRRTMAPPPPLPGAPLALEGLRSWSAAYVDQMIAEGYDWRDALDGLRPRVPELWRRLPPAEQAEFVRKHARGWELRRHRVPSPTAQRLRDLRASGRLRVAPGRVVGVRPVGDAVDVDIEPTRPASGTSVVRRLRVDRVICATGPCSDVTRTSHPLVRMLLARGDLAPDHLRLGLRCGPRAELVDATGRADERVRLIGPPLRGELWETTAVGEIRVQAERLASELAASLAVTRPDWVRRRLA